MIRESCQSDDDDSPQKSGNSFERSANKENTFEYQKNRHPAFITNQKSQNNTAKLCYKIDQLELLNAIYNEMKYPNSVQKTMIANIIGITREQTKVYLFKQADFEDVNLNIGFKNRYGSKIDDEKTR